jgi:hypothetical protein
MTGLPNRLQRTRETHPDHWLYRFANGLAVRTDPFMRADPSRVLPIGGPQDVILNRLVCFPEIVAGKRVFDPFAGSGVLGLMALRLGAAHVDFLDISARSQTFQIENAKHNGFAPDRFRAVLGAIEHFAPEESYDVVLANPPFVPTPSGIEGSLTSNGGPRGDQFVEQLLARLDRWLRTAGEAFIYVMQLVHEGQPSIADGAVSHLPERTIEFTPIQLAATPFDDYIAAYMRCFSGDGAAIRRWETELRNHYSGDLRVQHYVMYVSPRRPGAATWQITNNLAEKFGAGMAYPEAANHELALARVMENVVPQVH